MRIVLKILYVFLAGAAAAKAVPSQAWVRRAGLDRERESSVLLLPDLNLICRGHPAKESHRIRLQLRVGRGASEGAPGSRGPQDASAQQRPHLGPDLIIHHPGIDSASLGLPCGLRRVLTASSHSSQKLPSKQVQN